MFRDVCTFFLSLSHMNPVCPIHWYVCTLLVSYVSRKVSSYDTVPCFTVLDSNARLILDAILLCCVCNLCEGGVA